MHLILRSASAASAAFLLTALAQAQGAGKSAAVAAFDDAERLSEAGNYAEACPKYAESNRLDPQLGALMHLADCYEKAGLLASAWVAFHDATGIAKQRGDSRVQVAQARASSLEGRLSRLRIDPPLENIAGLELQRDGVPVDRALWALPLPVDSGSHSVSASAPGRITWETTVNIGSTGLTEVLSVPALTVAPAAVQTVATPAAAPLLKPQSTKSVVAPPEPDSGSARRALGWVGVGIGAVGLGIGTLFLVERADKLTTRDGICPTSNPPDCPIGSQARVDHFTQVADSATTHARVALIAGGVLAATGVVLLLTLPEHPSATIHVAPALGPGFQGMMVSGNVF